MNLRNHSLRPDAGRGHASLSGRSEHERDGFDARGDSRPRDADGRSASARSTDAAVSTVAAALAGPSARQRSVASRTPWSTLAARLSGCSLATGSAVSPAARLEQRGFDAHPTIVGQKRDRSSASAARPTARTAATRITALATAPTDAEGDDEIAAAERVTAGTTEACDAALSGRSGFAGIVAHVGSRFDRAEAEKGGRPRHPVGTRSPRSEYRGRNSSAPRLELDSEHDVGAVAAVTALDESVGARPLRARGAPIDDETRGRRTL
jgi:hypothetical protein